MFFGFCLGWRRWNSQQNTMRLHIRSVSFVCVVLICAVYHGRGEHGIPAALPQVSSLHPRIYVRHDAASIGAGLTLRQLRERAVNPLYGSWRRLVSGESLDNTVERAARYLETRSAQDLDAARRYLLAHTFSQRQHDVGGLLAGAEMALAYDWIFDGLAEAERTAILSNIVTTADSSYDFLLHGQPDVNHNYTYMALRTIAVCGLVLKGEEERFDRRATEYLALSQQWLEGPGKVLETWKAREGAWAEGSHYTFHETVRTLIMTLHAYRTATDIDYLAAAEQKYGGFVAGMGRFLIACTRPDLTFERIGDVVPSRALAAITVPLTVEMIAAGLGDREDQGRLRSFARELRQAYGDKAVHPSFDWGMRMFFDPHAPTTPSYKTQPPAQRLGVGTDEHIVFRSGWDPDSTQITILAGNHYTDHQHFDKGHFLIYHRGGLTVDGGTYDGMYVPGGHQNNYSTRTLAHNCLLVFNPEESLPKGYANDGGQVVLRGLQHHADWLSYLEHRQRERLGASRVTGYEVNAQAHFDYLRCDLAAAYGAKVESYDRQFVYLPDSDFLVVFDRVRSARPEFKKSWLLHFQDSPQVDGVTPTSGITRFDGAGTVRVVSRGQLDLGNLMNAYDGALSIRPLLPEKRTVTIVGGPGYEYFNTFNGTNTPPTARGRNNAPRESGAWRMELTPANSAADDLFLNAIQITDASETEMAEARLLTDVAQRFVGAWFAAQPLNRVVLFAKNPTPAADALPLRYEIDSPAESRHLLIGLAPNQRVSIRFNGGPISAATTGAQGTLSFADHRTGRRIIEVRPALGVRRPATALLRDKNPAFFLVPTSLLLGSSRILSLPGR